jgi:hypothetical protein
MLKYELVSNAGEYATVAERITLFYMRHPSGRIVTRLISRTAREITVQAFVYRSPDEQRPSATGLAAERIGNGDINTVACLENTETSAIGRALANLGLTASSQRPSRDEIEKANRARVARAAEALRRAGTTATGPRSRLTTPEPSARESSLQRRADRVVDALDVLSQAARAGLEPGRVRRLRALLTDADTGQVTIERVERMLRAWTAARHARHLRL